MLVRMILFLIFWLMALYGGFEVIRQARKMRASRKYKAAIFAWSEQPISSFKYETLSQIAISIHWLTVLLIGSIEFLVLAFSSFPAVASSLLSFFIAIIVVPIVGYLWGSVLFQPTSLSLAGNRHYAIAAEGILWAGQQVHWSAFTHFAFDRENRMICLWSSSFYGAVAFLLVPPPESLSKILELLHSHLPDETTVPAPGLLRQWSFPLVLAAVCGVATLISVLSTLRLPPDLALIANGFLLYAVVALGGHLFLRASLGNHMQPAVLEDDTPPG